jgi:hypothetical protein
MKPRHDALMTKCAMALSCPSGKPSKQLDRYVWKAEWSQIEI